MRRRKFLGLCSAGALALAQGELLRSVWAKGPVRRYDRVRLVDAHGKPVRAAALEVDEPYIFFYPYVGTPCYLIRLSVPTHGEDLKTAQGESYEWLGGVGPGKSIVAFAAICSHLMTHPSAKYSLINYHAEADKLSGRLNVITCCAHGSVYDPAAGGKVLEGPATQPLTAIELEYDAAGDGLYAVGTRGGELYLDFFRQFRHELREEFGRGNRARKIVRHQALLRPLREYTRSVVKC
ncbi:MAG: hypothetical protein D6721_04870 [Gammaproteobacteria bacterium]|nr:MAG: hypothetical protein D6721_04870 [Gammaproteobacteria bacterium]